MYGASGELVGDIVREVNPERKAAELNDTGTNESILRGINTHAAPSRAEGLRARPEQMATIVGIEGPSSEERLHATDLGA